MQAARIHLLCRRAAYTTIDVLHEILHHADNKILLEPVNLGPGWKDFDFSAFGKPYQIINDAAMQAAQVVTRAAVCSLSALAPAWARPRRQRGGGGPGIGTSALSKKTFEQYVGSGAEAAGQEEMAAPRIRRGNATQGRVYRRLRGTRRRQRQETHRTARRGAAFGDNNNAFVGGERLWTPRVASK